MTSRVHCVLLLILVLGWSQAVPKNNLDELLNWCIKGVHHKSAPGPESNLYNQCEPWKERSCCTSNTTRSAHVANLYNFDFDHCAPLSPSCKRHFIQDLCFFECSPNVGPWVVEVQMKTRKERFFGVPLCASDCETWFDSCRNDLTCTSNWLRNFDWTGGKNRCTEGSSCKTFENIFESAANFCEKVWDGSWKVVPDEQPCMRMWFNTKQGPNPNDEIARIHAQELVRKSATGSSASTDSNSKIFLLPVIALYKILPY